VFLPRHVTLLRGIRKSPLLEWNQRAVVYFTVTFRLTADACARSTIFICLCFVYLLLAREKAAGARTGHAHERKVGKWRRMLGIVFGTTLR